MKYQLPKYMKMNKKITKRCLNGILLVATALIGLAIPTGAQAEPESTASDLPGGLALLTSGSHDGTPSQQDTLRLPESYYLKGSRFWRTETS